MNSITKRFSLVLIPLMVLILSNCDMVKGLPGMSDPKTEKLIKNSDILVYALLDAKGESETFIKKNEQKDKLDKNKVKRISVGLKKLAGISDPAKAKTQGEKLFKQLQSVSSRAAGGDPKLIPYAGDLIDLIGKYKRLFDEWDKIPGNVTGGKGALAAWNKFLESKGAAKGKAKAGDKKAGKKKKGKKKKKKKR